MLNKPIFKKTYISAPTIPAQTSASILVPTATETETELSVSKPKIEVPRFKTLLKLVRSSEMASSENYNNNYKPALPVHSKYSSSRGSIDYGQSIINSEYSSNKSKQIQLNKLESASANFDTKTQKIVSYRNLLKTTREKFKKNLIDYMNERKDRKETRNIGYRFPMLQSRTTHRTLETVTIDEEQSHAQSHYVESSDNFQNITSKSLPNIGNYYYHFNKRKSDDDTDFKLPNVQTGIVNKLPDQFVSDKSLKEDSLFWSKYKRTITRQMKLNNEAYAAYSASNSSVRTSNTNNNNQITSIIEELSDDRKYNQKKYIDNDTNSFKSPVSDKHVRKSFDDKSNKILSDNLTSSVTNRMSEVTVKY